MVATTVHLLRHGEVDNPGQVLYGRLPGFGLSDRGHVMATAAARHLAGSPDRPRADLVYLAASPLERAQLTAAPVAAEFGLTINRDDNLIEADNIFTGQVISPGFLLRPDHLVKLHNPWRPSWGEPYSVIAARMKSAIDQARDAARGHEAVLVSHQLPVWVARRAAQNRGYFHNPRRRQCALGSISSLRFDDDRLVNITYTEPTMPDVV